MKILQKIACFLTGHVKWETPGSGLALCLPGVHSPGAEPWFSVEICPRCKSLWVYQYVKQKNPDDDFLFKIIDDDELSDFEISFNNEFGIVQHRVTVSYKKEFINSDFEIKSKSGKVSAWTLDAPESGVYEKDDQDKAYDQIRDALNKCEDPEIIYVSQSVYNVLDYYMINGSALKYGRSKKIR